MDLGAGRRTAFPAARLAVIGGLFVLLAVLRWGGGEARANEEAEASSELLGAEGGAAEGEAAVEPSPSAPATPPLAGIPAAEREAREAEVEAVIARWMKTFEKEARGKATARDVTVAMQAIELSPARGGLLVSRLADASLLPASNMKLVTSIGALKALSPEGRFTTRVVAAAAPVDGVLRGDLVVLAGGDPITDEDATGAGEARLDALAREVAAAGVRRVTGALVLDEGRYAEPAPAPGWPSESQHWADYCALSGGFSVNGGVLRATLSGSSGELAVRVRPAPHGLRENYGVKTGSKNDVRVGATATSCTVKGQIPAAQVSRFAASFAHPDPVDLFGAVFAAALKRAGVEVAGGVERRRDAAPVNARVLAVMYTPILDVLVPINTHSNNPVSEQLLLAVGDAVAGEGSRAGGMRAVQGVLADLGIPTDGYHQADGSGLSRDNRVTVRQLCALLESAWRMPPPARDAFFDSLAVAGRSGTLDDRMRGTAAEGRVHAKTGWISGASSLSGLARGPGDRAVLFSILVSYPRSLGGMNTRVFKPMQNELVLTLLGARE